MESVQQDKREGLACPNLHTLVNDYKVILENTLPTLSSRGAMVARQISIGLYKDLKAVSSNLAGSVILFFIIHIIHSRN